VTEHLSTTTHASVTTARLAPPNAWMTSSPRRRYHDDDRDRKQRVSEHARFVRAKTELEKRHHEKVNKVRVTHARRMNIHADLNALSCRYLLKRP